MAHENPGTDLRADLHAAILDEDEEAIRDHGRRALQKGLPPEDLIGILLRSTGDGTRPTDGVAPLADFLVHLELQAPQSRHLLFDLKTRRQNFRRIEPPPAAAGSPAELRRRLEEAAIGNDAELAERCLLGLLAAVEPDEVFRCVLSILLEPRYLGATAGSWWAGLRHRKIGCLLDLRDRYGDSLVIGPLAHIGAKECARRVPVQDERSEEAVARLEEALRNLEATSHGSARSTEMDERALRGQLASGSTAGAFGAVLDAWRSGMSVERLDLALTMLCVERLLRAAHGRGANWDDLKRELTAAATVRKIGSIDKALAYRAALHAVWQIVRHGDAGLAEEIPEAAPTPIVDQDEEIGYVIERIGHSDAAGAIAQTYNFLAGGHDREALLRRLAIYINSDSVGQGWFAGQRTYIDAWYQAAEHPERDRILLAFAGHAADYRNQHLDHSKRFGATVNVKVVAG